MKIRSLLLIVLTATLLAAGLTAVWTTVARHAVDAGVAAGTALSGDRFWLTLLAGIGLVAVLVERVKRRRI